MFKQLITLRSCSFLFVLFIVTNSVHCHAFDVYFYNNQNHRPTLETSGVHRSIILYEQFFYDAHEDRKKSIRESKLNEIYKRIEKSNADVVHIDIEAWLGQSLPINSSYIDRYLELITDLKAHYPEKKFSYYEVVPTWAHWNILKNPLRKLSWDLENQRRQKIADASDSLSPCLYTYHETYEEWEAWADLILQEAKKMAKGKPVIPFIWPKFHQSAINPAYAEKFLPKSYWRDQLKFLATHADGVIVWTDDLQGAWDDKADWWHEFNLFLSTLQTHQSSSTQFRQI